MLNSDTAAPRRIKDTRAQQALLNWFDLLAQRYGHEEEQRINGRAWRAELRRVEPPYGALTCEGYDALRRQLGAHMPLSPLHQMALALFAGVAAHIKTHNGKLSFGAQLGEKLNGNDPCVSVLRFERLQKAADPESFSQLLIRAVKIRGHEGVNVLSLADSILLWMEEWQRRSEHQPETTSPFERNRIRWASEYLTTSRAR